MMVIFVWFKITSQLLCSTLQTWISIMWATSTSFQGEHSPLSSCCRRFWGCWSSWWLTRDNFRIQSAPCSSSFSSSYFSSFFLVVHWLLLFSSTFPNSLFYFTFQYKGNFFQIIRVQSNHEDSSPISDSWNNLHSIHPHPHNPRSINPSIRRRSWWSLEFFWRELSGVHHLDPEWFLDIVHKLL